MLDNFAKIKIYKPVFDVLAYFIPAFVVVLFGYYAHYSVIDNIVTLTVRFNIFLQFFIVLTSLTAIGKLIFEITSRLLNVFTYIYYYLSVFLRKREGILKNVGDRIQNSSIKANRKEVPATILHSFFSKEELFKSWYFRVKTNAVSFQTSLGASLIGFFVFDNNRILFLFIVLILIYLSFSARKNLMHAEIELEKLVSAK